MEIFSGVLSALETPCSDIYAFDVGKANRDQQDELANQSADAGHLLTHLVRGDTPQPKHVLHSILSGEDGRPILKAAEIGWYAGSGDVEIWSPMTGRFEAPPQKKAVCFTESTLLGLRAHRDIFQVQYGLAFRREYLNRRGANPCINLRQELLNTSVEFQNTARSLYEFMPAELVPYVNTINERFDATQEREWRYVGDLPFETKDVLLIFCPETDFGEFAAYQHAGKPSLFDLQWL